MALQEDWRWCGVCEGLVYTGFSHGMCLDGSPHEVGNSGRYGVGFGDPPSDGAQAGWLWCARCQALFTSAGEGRCFDGDGHDPNGSGPYWVHLDDVPDGAQDMWRWCARCSRLIYDGFGDGICWDGAAHDLSQSGAYSVDMIMTPADAPDPEPTPLPEPAPAPAPAPAIVLAEHGSLIEVSGSGFTPGGRVAVAFVRGSEVKKVGLAADGDGAFEHVERGARPSSATGIAIARDEATPRFATAGLQRLFPFPPDGTVLIDHGAEAVPG